MTSARRASGEQTRAQVLEVALELFAAQGFAATSTRELAERLGFTKAALYYYFRTKEELLAALLAPSLEALALLVEGRSPRPAHEGRRDLLLGYQQMVVSNQRVIQVLSQDPSIARSSVSTAAAPLYERLTVLLAGTPTPSPGQRVRARAALGAIHSALLHAAPDEPAPVVHRAAHEAACGALGVA